MLAAIEGVDNESPEVSANANTKILCGMNFLS
jgi:hypothetical protein